MTSNGLLLSRQGWTARFALKGLFTGLIYFVLIQPGPSLAQDVEVESPPEPQEVQPIGDQGAPAIPNAIANGNPQPAPLAQSSPTNSTKQLPSAAPVQSTPQGKSIQALPVVPSDDDAAIVESAPGAGDYQYNSAFSPTTNSSAIQPSPQITNELGPLAQADNDGPNDAGNNAGGNAGNQPAAGAAELSGFNESPWETSFKDVRKMMKDLSASPKSDDKVELLYEQKDRLLTIRRNDVVYIYRFYQPPEKILEFKVSGTGNPASGANPNNELDKHPEYKYGRLFFVTMQLPLLTAKDVEGALTAKYNKPNQPLVDDDGAGVLIWNLNGGFVFQWIEKFDGKLYTRRVDYISSKVREELAGDYQLYFTAKEKKLLKDAKF